MDVAQEGKKKKKKRRNRGKKSKATKAEEPVVDLTVEDSDVDSVSKTGTENTSSDAAVDVDVLADLKNLPTVRVGSASPFLRTVVSQSVVLGRTAK